MAFRIRNNPLRSLTTHLNPARNTPSPTSPTRTPTSPTRDGFDTPRTRSGTGDKSKWWDRHRPGVLNNPQIMNRPHPAQPGNLIPVNNVVPNAQWHNVAKQRIGELFKTQQGFAGHNQQVQGLFGQLSNSVRAGQISPKEAQTLLSSLATDMQKSLKRANFDVAPQALTSPGLGTLHFGKQGGKDWSFFQPE